jgi:hypothetical protein
LLHERHLRDCRVLASRDKLLELLPQQAICAEVGIWKCEFSEKILRRARPSTLHLIDISAESCRLADHKFAQEIGTGGVVIHCGDSSPIIKSFPDAYFDWIYVDGNHSYEGAKKDLEACRTKVVSGGLILLNDYIYFSPVDFRKYGVVEAVNAFLLNYDWEIVYFCLHPRMYCDVAIRRING